MNDVLDVIREGWRDPELRRALVAMGIFVFGVVVARIVSGLLGRVVATRAGAQRTMIARRVSFVAFGGLAVAGALQFAGVDMSIFFGAAGILTVALGFASQTSMSNLISGAFLIGERAFEVGDVITVGATTGEVLSIDLLSVKLRALDNVFVRVPNETLIKAEISNLSRFPIRRIELDFRVGYETDLATLAERLREIVAEVPICLVDPPAQFFVQDFTEAGVWAKLRFWARREVFVDARSAVQAEAQRVFREMGVTQPTQRFRMES